MSLQEEIFQQPEILRNLINTQWNIVRETVEKIRQHEFDYIFMTGRGSSGFAGLYAKYLYGIRNELPLSQAAPSIFSIYNKSPKLKKALILGISQSGESPDIVKVVKEGRRQGAPTLAITNKPHSPLAQASEYVLDIIAGTEHAVAATKSYTAELMVIAMVSLALSGGDLAMDELCKVPDYVEQVLGLDNNIKQLVESYSSINRCVVLGRGLNYPTTLEWALKLKELAYVLADPYSTADFLHGPIAFVEEGFPVMVIAPEGGVYSRVHSVTKRILKEKHPKLLIVSNSEELLSITDARIPLPSKMPEWVSPIVCIVPGQLFSYHLAKIKGHNTEQPRGLKKVTHTR